MSEPPLEFSTVIEVWFNADNTEDAESVTKRLAERVLEHPDVIQVEAEAPEEQA